MRLDQRDDYSWVIVIASSSSFHRLDWLTEEIKVSERTATPLNNRDKNNHSALLLLGRKECVNANIQRRRTVSR